MTTPPPVSPLSDEKLNRLSKEYRASMDRNVLHEWALDVVRAVNTLRAEKAGYASGLRAGRDAREVCDALLAAEVAPRPTVDREGLASALADDVCTIFDYEADEGISSQSNFGSEKTVREILTAYFGKTLSRFTFPSPLPADPGVRGALIKTILDTETDWNNGAAGIMDTKAGFLASRILALIQPEGGEAKSADEQASEIYRMADAMGSATNVDGEPVVDLGKQDRIHLAAEAYHALDLARRASPPTSEGVSVPVVIRDALTGISDDYMTSDTHHPGHVVIPVGRFDLLLNAEEALAARPSVGDAASEPVSDQTAGAGEWRPALGDRGFSEAELLPAPPPPDQWEDK